MMIEIGRGSYSSSLLEDIADASPEGCNGTEVAETTQARLTITGNGYVCVYEREPILVPDACVAPMKPVTAASSLLQPGPGQHNGNAH